jgi:hypothetical protein
VYKYQVSFLELSSLFSHSLLPSHCTSKPNPQLRTSRPCHHHAISQTPSKDQVGVHNPPIHTPTPNKHPTGDFTVTATVHNDTYPAIDPTTQNLTGKAVFITGASRGIGASIAASFAKAGASYIILAARSSLDATESDVKKAAQNAGRPLPEVLQLKLDVTNPTSVSDAAAQVKRAVGRLDVIVNNAGLVDVSAIHESDPEKWWAVWEVNVKGPFLIAKYFLPLMLEDEDSLKQVVTVSRYAFSEYKRDLRRFYHAGPS